MKSEILKFFNIQRQIFGVCPECMEFIRLSDSRVFQRTKPNSSVERSGMHLVRRWSFSQWMRSAGNAG